MNDYANTEVTVDTVDPVVPFVTDAPGIVTDGDNVEVHVAEDTVDIPVAGIEPEHTDVQ